MIVVFIFLFILVIEHEFFFTLLYSRFENFIRPLVFLPPIILLRFVLKVMVAYIRISVRYTDIYPFVLENS
jgi:hypothetical protein